MMKDLMMKGSEDSVEMVISRLVGSRAKKKSYDQVWNQVVRLD